MLLFCSAQPHRPEPIRLHWQIEPGQDRSAIRQAVYPQFWKLKGGYRGLS